MVAEESKRVVDEEYARVLQEIHAVSGAYGRNSPHTYLSDYAPRITAQIRTLLALIEAHGLSGGRLLSIGGWPGISGVVLQRITGIAVTLIDHPSVLGDGFSDFYQANGLETVPFDFSESVHIPIPVSGEFDLIECCQCMEHWNFNPICALKDIFSRVLSPAGYMLVTVPNAVSLHRRLFTLMGINPYPAMRSFIDAAEGLPGAEVAPHWREYTRQDLAMLMEYVGGETISLTTRHHKMLYKKSIFQHIHQTLHHLHPSLKSNIEIVVRRKSGREGPNR